MKPNGRRYKRKMKRLDRIMTLYRILRLNDCCGFVAGILKAEEREISRNGSKRICNDTEIGK